MHVWPGDWGIRPYAKERLFNDFVAYVKGGKYAEFRKTALGHSAEKYMPADLRLQLLCRYGLTNSPNTLWLLWKKWRDNGGWRGDSRLLPGRENPPVVPVVQSA